MDEVDSVVVEGVDLAVVDEVVDEKVDLELGNLLSELGIVHSERAAEVDAVVSEEEIGKVEVGLKRGNEVVSQEEVEVTEDQEVALGAVDEEEVDSVVEVEEAIGEDSVDVEVTEEVETDTSRLHHSHFHPHSHRDRTLSSSCLGTEQEDQQDNNTLRITYIPYPLHCCTSEIDTPHCLSPLASKAVLHTFTRNCNDPPLFSCMSLDNTTPASSAYTTYLTLLLTHIPNGNLNLNPTRPVPCALERQVIGSTSAKNPKIPDRVLHSRYFHSGHPRMNPLCPACAPVVEWDI